MKEEQCSYCKSTEILCAFSSIDINCKEEKKYACKKHYGLGLEEFNFHKSIIGIQELNYKLNNQILLNNYDKMSA